MAIFGFLFQVRPSLQGRGEVELRAKAAIGGVVGLGFGLLVVVLAVTV